MKICRNCGEVNSDSNSFCTKCGTPLPASGGQPGMKYCISCGSQIMAGASYCTVCGAKQPARTDHTTGRISEPENNGPKLFGEEEFGDDRDVRQADDSTRVIPSVDDTGRKGDVRHASRGSSYDPDEDFDDGPDYKYAVHNSADGTSRKNTRRDDFEEGRKYGSSRKSSRYSRDDDYDDDREYSSSRKSSRYSRDDDYDDDREYSSSRKSSRYSREDDYDDDREYSSSRKSSRYSRDDDYDDDAEYSRPSGRKVYNDDYRDYDDDGERRSLPVILLVIGIGVAIIAAAIVAMLFLGRMRRAGSSTQPTAHTTAAAPSSTAQKTTKAAETKKEEKKTEEAETEFHTPGMESMLKATLAFTSTSSESVFKNGSRNLMDFDVSTAWAEGVSGAGESEQIILDLPQETKVFGIAIAPGYQVSSDTYKNYGRPTELIVTMNGESELISLSSYEPDFVDPNDTVAFIPFKKPVRTKQVKIAISGVKEGKKYSDTCISELYAYTFLSDPKPRPQFKRSVKDSTGAAPTETEAPETKESKKKEKKETSKDETTKSKKNGGSGDYILPDSDTTRIEKSDLEGLSKDELRMAINEIYARHGRKFKNAEVQEYFDEKDWYTPEIDPDTFDKNSSQYLSNTEVKNIATIREYQKEKGYK